MRLWRTHLCVVAWSSGLITVRPLDLFSSHYLFFLLPLLSSPMLGVDDSLFHGCLHLGQRVGPVTKLCMWFCYSTQGRKCETSSYRTLGTGPQESVHIAGLGLNPSSSPWPLCFFLAVLTSLGLFPHVYNEVRHFLALPWGWNSTTHRCVLCLQCLFAAGLLLTQVSSAIPNNTATYNLHLQFTMFLSILIHYQKKKKKSKFGCM